MKHKSPNKLIFTVVILCLCLAVSNTAEAKQKNASTSGVSIISEIAEFIGKLGESFSIFAEGIEKATKSTFRTIDIIKARQSSERLYAIYRSLGILSDTQRTLFGSIDDYLEKPNKLDWEQIQNQLKDLSKKVMNLQESIGEEKKYFVIEPAYLKLRETLNKRLIILRNLKNLPPPSSEQELNDLKKLGLAYKKLHSQLIKVNGNLRDYLKKFDKQISEQLD